MGFHRLFRVDSYHHEITWEFCVLFPDSDEEKATVKVGNRYELDFHYHVEVCFEQSPDFEQDGMLSDPLSLECICFDNLGLMKQREF